MTFQVFQLNILNSNWVVIKGLSSPLSSSVMWVGRGVAYRDFGAPLDSLIPSSVFGSISNQTSPNKRKPMPDLVLI
jgi:hypothetical protein